jgi:phage terminase large subunit-like protein
MALTEQERDELAVLGVEAARRAGYKIRRYFPEAGPYRRALYPQHLKFFEAGQSFTERLFLKANRTGGTQAAACEVTYHLTGEYPAWWPGRRFEQPVDAWAACDTGITTRDVCQLELYGPAHDPQTGFLPAHLILDTSPKGGIPDGLDTIRVRHVPTGGISTLQFKSYKEGRASFYGTAKHVIWLDEEPDQAIEEECLLRTMTTNGIVLITFTPLQGLTPFVLGFLETAVMASATGDLMPARSELWRQAAMETPDVD